MDIKHLLIWSRAKLIRRREVESNRDAEAYAISTGLGTHPGLSERVCIQPNNQLESRAVCLTCRADTNCSESSCLERVDKPMLINAWTSRRSTCRWVRSAATHSGARCDSVRVECQIRNDQL